MLPWRLFGFSIALLVSVGLADRPAQPARPAQFSGPQLPPELASVIRDADGLVAAAVARATPAALTIGIVSGSTLVWTKGYGYQDLGRRVPAAAETIYRIGSITKQVTAVALVQLQERGRLRMSDPAAKYLPEVKAIADPLWSASAITLLELATMTSGLDREPDDLPAYLVGPVEDWEKVLLAALPRTRFAWEPGTRYHYSNIGYAVLGAALGRAAGEPFVNYVMREILAPLGMSTARFQVPARDRAHLAVGHAVRDKVVDLDTPRREHEGRGYKIPNGGLYATVSDVARWLAFEIGDVPPAVLSRQAFNEWLGRIHSAGPDLGHGYGIGFEVTRRPTLVALGHTGSVAGYTSAAYVDRRSQTGVVVLRAAGGDSLDVTELCLSVLEKVAGAQPRPSARP